MPHTQIKISHFVNTNNYLAEAEEKHREEQIKVTKFTKKTLLSTL